MLRTWVTFGPGHSSWPKPALWLLEAETEPGACYGQVLIAPSPDLWPVGMRYMAGSDSYTEMIAYVCKEAEKNNRWRLLSEEEAAVLLLGGV